MMAQGKQETWWDSPKFTIDCVLANVNRQLEADGCVLERLELGVGSSPLITCEQGTL
jgi:hypothetical protein